MGAVYRYRLDDQGTAELTDDRFDIVDKLVPVDAARFDRFGRPGLFEGELLVSAIRSGGSVYLYDLALPCAGHLGTRNGSDVNPSILGARGAPMLGTTWSATVDLSAHGGTSFVVLLGRDRPAIPQVLLPAGEVLIELALGEELLARVAPAGSSGSLELAVTIPVDPTLVGLQAFLQSALIGTPTGWILTNALDLALGSDT